MYKQRLDSTKTTSKITSITNRFLGIFSPNKKGNNSTHAWVWTHRSSRQIWSERRSAPPPYLNLFVTVCEVYKRCTQFIEEQEVTRFAYLASPKPDPLRVFKVSHTLAFT